MWTILKRCYVLLGRHDLSLMAGGVAFFAMLSLFPALAAFIAIFGLFASPDLIQGQIENMSLFLPQDVVTVLVDQAVALASSDARVLTWTTLVSVVFAIWSARSGIGALQRGIFSIGHGRPPEGLRATLMALGLTLLMVFVGVVALVTIVVLPIAFALIPILGDWQFVIEMSRWAIVLSVVLAAFGILYALGVPQRGRVPFAQVAPGAVAAVVLWFAVSWGFSQYISSYGSYDRVYGSIGAVIALLMWLYLSAYVVFLGFVLNMAIAEK